MLSLRSIQPRVSGTSGEIDFVRVVTSLVLALLCAAPTVAAERLAWKFKSGDKYLIATEQTMRMRDLAPTSVDSSTEATTPPAKPTPTKPPAANRNTPQSAPQSDTPPSNTSKPSMGKSGSGKTGTGKTGTAKSDNSKPASGPDKESPANKLPQKGPIAPPIEAAAEPSDDGAKIGMDTEWQVTNVDAKGNASIVQTVRRLHISMDLPDKSKLLVDTKAPDAASGAGAKQLLGLIQPLIGVKVNLVVSPTGEVTKVQLGPEVRQAIQGAAASPLQGMFSEEGIKNMHKQLGAILPVTAVEVGGTWQSLSESRSMFGGMQISNKFTYVGRENRQRKPVEKIEYETIYSILPDADIPAGVKVDVQDQTGTGVAYFDATTGRFLESQSTSNMTMATTIGKETAKQQISVATRTTFQLQK